MIMSLSIEITTSPTWRPQLSEINITTFAVKTPYHVRDKIMPRLQDDAGSTSASSCKRDIIVQISNVGFFYGYSNSLTRLGLLLHATLQVIRNRTSQDIDTDLQTKKIRLLAKVSSNELCVWRSTIRQQPCIINHISRTRYSVFSTRRAQQLQLLDRNHISLWLKSRLVFTASIAGTSFIGEFLFLYSGFRRLYKISIQIRSKRIEQSHEMAERQTDRQTDRQQA